MPCMVLVSEMASRCVRELHVASVPVLDVCVGDEDAPVHCSHCCGKMAGRNSLIKEWFMWAPGFGPSLWGGREEFMVAVVRGRSVSHFGRSESRAGIRSRVRLSTLMSHFLCKKVTSTPQTAQLSGMPRKHFYPRNHLASLAK